MLLDEFNRVSEIRLALNILGLEMSASVTLDKSVSLDAFSKLDTPGNISCHFADHELLHFLR